jgi:hypothetical protein
MKVTRELEAHQIVDKNGVHRTVWKKPSESKAARFAAIKPILAPKPSVNRRDDELTVSGYLKDFNDELREKGRTTLQERPIDIAVSKCSDAEIRVLAEAMDSGDEAIREMILREGAGNYNFVNAINAAAVYTPDLYKGEYTSRYRMLVIAEAVEKAYYAIHLDAPDGGWNLTEESESSRAKIKRLVRVWSVVVGYDDNTPDPNGELMQRMMDDNRTDHEEMFTVLRDNPKATCAQIDFILSGGTAAVSSGML